MTDNPKLGFIGLGLMGKPMALNLLKAGYPLVVHNRSREVVAELVAAGAEQAFSPQEVSSKVEIVFTNLPDSPDVEEVTLGENGILSGAKRDWSWLTIPPSNHPWLGRSLKNSLLREPSRSMPPSVVVISEPRTALWQLWLVVQQKPWREFDPC